MRSVDFYGYSVYEDGRIINRHGRELKQRTSRGRREIRLSVNGERFYFTVNRLVYCVFNNIDIFKLDKDRCVTFNTRRKTCSCKQIN